MLRREFFLPKPLKRYFMHYSDSKSVCKVKIYTLNFTIIFEPGNQNFHNPVYGHFVCREVQIDRLFAMNE